MAAARRATRLACSALRYRSAPPLGRRRRPRAVTRHPDAPAWLPDTFCLTCNKMAETISYIDHNPPGGRHMWERVSRVRCHGAVVERTGPTAFPICEPA